MSTCQDKNGKVSKRTIASSPTKPTALKPCPDLIPQELKDRRQWIVWRFVRKNGKWTKVPVSAKTGTICDATDSKSWATFDEAYAYYLHRCDKSDWTIDGIGFAFSPDDPYCGVDLDDCIDHETGEIAEWAGAFLKDLNSYAEISPSGLGAKVWTKARKNGDKCKKKYKTGEVEMYDRGRFFAVTGRHMSEYPTTIEDRQEVVDRIYAEVFGQTNGRTSNNTGRFRARAPGKNEPPRDDEEIITTGRRVSPKFAAAFDGDISQWNDDDSAADQSLNNNLAWLLHSDRARMDRIFRQSKLMRDKWNREDYREGTIDKAVAQIGGDYFDWSTCNRSGHTDNKPWDGQSHFRLRNFWEDEVQEGEEQNRRQRKIRIGFSAARIADDLLRFTKDWPKRVGNILFVREGDDILWLESAPELFAWIGRTIVRQQCETGQNEISWTDEGTDKVSRAEFFSYLQQTVEQFDAIEKYPHYPELPRHYYCLAGEPKGTGGEALAALISRFSGADPAVDRDLIEAFFLSLFWGGEDTEQRPAWLFTSEENEKKRGRGVGKSTIVKMAGKLVGGHVDISPNDRLFDTTKRLLSPVAMEKRIVLIDNIKTLKISSGELEGLITNDVISGHRMFHGEGQRPNTLVYCLTVNGAGLSKDMAERCVCVCIKRPKYRGKWSKETLKLIKDRRWEIIGDILDKLRGEPVQSFGENKRWSAWEDQVLSRVSMPAECQALITERADLIDEDDAEADVVRTYFVERLTHRRHCVDEQVIFLPAYLTAEWVCAATREPRPTTRANVHLAGLQISELRRSRTGAARGWVWHGSAAPATANAISLNPLPT